MIQKEPTCWPEDLAMLLKALVGVVKKRHCHEKRCRGTGCAVAQQACSKVRTSLKYKSDL